MLIGLEAPSLHLQQDTSCILISYLSRSALKKLHHLVLVFGFTLEEEDIYKYLLFIINYSCDEISNLQLSCTV